MEHFADAFKKYAVFRGRATRTQFWWFILIATVISIALLVLDNAIGTVSDGPGLQQGLFGAIFSLVIFLPSLALIVRRLHDTGKSGWWALILLVPCVGLIAWFVFALQASEPGENRWGRSELS